MSIRKSKARSTWTLIDVMRARGIRTSTQLHRALEEYLPFSYDQTRRLVHRNFKELPTIDVLDALCRVLECSVADLIPIDHHRDESLVNALDAHRKKRHARKTHVDAVAAFKPLGDPTNVEPVEI